MVVVFGLFMFSFETCVIGMDYVLCLWHFGIRASRFLESIHGRWIVLFGIHMSASALHFCWRLLFGNLLVGVAWVKDTFSIRISESRNNIISNPPFNCGIVVMSCLILARYLQP